MLNHHSNNNNTKINNIIFINEQGIAQKQQIKNLFIPQPNKGVAYVPKTTQLMSWFVSEDLRGWWEYHDLYNFRQEFINKLSLLIEEIKPKISLLSYIYLRFQFWFRLEGLISVIHVNIFKVFNINHLDQKEAWNFILFKLILNQRFCNIIKKHLPSDNYTRKELREILLTDISSVDFKRLLQVLYYLQDNEMPTPTQEDINTEKEIFRK